RGLWLRHDRPSLAFGACAPPRANPPPPPKAPPPPPPRVEDVLALPIPMLDLAEESAAWERKLRVAAEQDSELADYVRELEERSGDSGMRAASGDEIAQGVEKYLRRRGGQTPN